MLDYQILDALKWEGNSRFIFLIVEKELPWLLKSGLERMTVEWVEKHKVTIITEDIIFQILSEIVPKMIMDRAFPKLKRMRASKFTVIRLIQYCIFSVYLRFS